MKKLRITTWKGRNKKSLINIRKNTTIQNPVILEVGIGGIIPKIAKFHPEGEKEDFSLIQKIFRLPLRLIENQLKKRRKFESLISFEPFEILELFKDLSPKIIILDKEEFLLEQLPENFQKLKLNIITEEILISVDILICYNLLLIPKFSNYFNQLLSKLKGIVKVGGLLCIDKEINFNDKNFKDLGFGVYRKLK